MKESFSQPYFGRVDFCQTPEEETEVDRHYIGKHQVPGAAVWSWTAPVASLFYKPGSTGYPSPSGFISGRVELKRQFQIEESQLLNFSDILALRPAARGQPAGGGVDPALARVLASASEAELREIVQTIQPEQYEQIAAVERPVLIVQGAAGSGKSLIGLHRLAYLLSPFSGLQATWRPQARRVIMLGPSPAFLKYVANLLPSLDQRDIRQTTLRDWLVSTFSERPRLEKIDKLLHRFLSNRRLSSSEEYEAERFKGSRAMGDLLEQHVRSLRKKFTARVAEISIPQQGDIPLVISRDEVTKLANSFDHLPLNRARDRIVGDATRSLLAQNAVDAFRDRSRLVREEVQSSVEQQVTAFWPRVKYELEYRSILAGMRDLVQGEWFHALTSIGHVPGRIG